jgi:hypothetical protein
VSLNLFNTEPEERITWDEVVPPEHWCTYKCVLAELRVRGIPFALGGGLALGAYTGRLRRSKDLDIYMLPDRRESIIGLMSACGLVDYHDTVPYDRSWIYRGASDGVIVDAIWAMANKRATVDERWLEAGPTVSMFGVTFRVIPPEELIWSKLYVMQRDRCDWPDLLNLLYATGATLDWDHLLHRVAEDKPLVKGLLSVFAWLCPEAAVSIPRRVWSALELPTPQGQQNDPEGRPSRKDLLDTRPWLFTEPQYSCA